jgi:hypothetical protein
LNDSLSLVSHHKGQAQYIDTRGTRTAQWDWFPDAASLEFVHDGVVGGDQTNPLSAARIRFNTTKAGLLCDDWRRRMPQKVVTFSPYLYLHFCTYHEQSHCITSGFHQFTFICSTYHH